MLDRSYVVYDNALHEPRAPKPAAAGHTAAPPRSLYAVAFFAGARVEHYTSSIVKAANALLLEEHELPALGCYIVSWRKRWAADPLVKNGP